MSNMLEQAIADAAALREQAIKNAEQSVIEKYSHQIKEAVDQMLEADGDPVAKVDEVINEVEEGQKAAQDREPDSHHTHTRERSESNRCSSREI